MLRHVVTAGLIALPCTGWPQEPVSYPPSEPSPFMPDDARYIGGGNAKLIYFRGEWQIAGPVKRAVLCVAPRMTVSLFLDGRLVAEGHSTHVGRPE